MPREKDGFRENLELLNKRFPDHDMLTIKEVQQVTRYASRKTVLKHMGKHAIGGSRISKVYVARFMCEEEKNNGYVR